MKKLGTKLTLLLMAFVFVTVTVCCVTMVGNNASASVAVAETEISNSYYQLTYSSQGIELLLNGDYHDYANITKSDLTTLANEVVSALRDIIVDGILDKNDGLALASDISIDIDPSEFDWNSSELLSQFKDYVVDRLSDSEEFQKYVDGEYDILIDYAIGNYIESKKDEIEDLQAEYDKIQSAIQDVVDEAYDNAVEDAREQLGEYFDEEEWISKKEEASNKVVERVENVQENGGSASISVKQIISAINRISINGSDLYSSDNGLYLDGVRDFISALPTPAEIADMSDSQMKNLIDWDIEVGTTFGDLDFNLTFGLFGDVSSIRTLARKLADNIALSVDGSNVSLEVNVPEVFTKALRNFYSSSNFTDSQKEIIFDLFNKSLDEVDLSNAIAFLKDVDYQYWLSNVYNAEYMNYYFGSYASQILGRQFTDTTIDNLITKVYNFVAPKADRIQDISLDEVKNWLNDNVPGASSITDSAKLNSLAERLLDIVNRIDWAKYDAEYIREVILGDEIDFNGKIVDYLDRFENSERFYDATVRYLERAIELLPSNVTDKSLLDCFADGTISFSYSYTVDFESLFSRIANFVRRHGYETVAKYIDNASVLLDRNTLDINLSAVVNVSSVYRVDYEIADQVVASGLLPSGLKGDIVSSLSGIKSVDGYDVLYWVIKGENNAIEVMPNEDIVLVPVFGFSATIDGAIDCIYDEANEYLLNPVITDGVPGAVYSYAWYKDGEFISAEQSISVKYVADSGVYGLVITDVSSGMVVTCDDVVVSIAHKSVQAPESWNGEYSFVYGEDIQVSYDIVLPEIYTELVYSFNDGENEIDINNYDWNVGTYYAKAVVELLDENYVSTDGARYWTLNATIVVTPKIVEAPANWGEIYVITYGSAFGISYDGIPSDSRYAYSEIVYAYTKGGQAIDITDKDFAWNVGDYIVTASFGLNSDNYATADGNREWTQSSSIQICAKTLDIYAQWILANSNSIYDGKEKSAYITFSGELNDDELDYVNSIISYTVNGVPCDKISIIDAGEYELIVVISETNPNYSIETHYLNPYTWTINRATVDVSVEWKYTEPFVYNGQTQFVGYSMNVTCNNKVLSKNYYTVEKSGYNARKDCGEYSYAITLSLTNNNYIFRNNESKITHSIGWEIHPYEIELESFGVWNAQELYVFGEQISALYQLNAPEYFTEISYAYSDANGNEIDLDDVLHIGQYTVTASFDLINDNYAILGSEQRSWSLNYGFDITPKIFELDGAKWIYPENSSYDGNAKEIYLNLDKTSLSVADRDLVLSLITYTLNNEIVTSPIKLVEAGTYTISISLDNNDYVIVGIGSLEYVIQKGKVSVDVSFDYDSPFEYDGLEHEIAVDVKLTLNSKALNEKDYEIIIKGIKADKPGEYNATVEIILKNASLELDGESKYECAWVINKRASNEPFEVGHKFTTNGIGVEILEGTVPGDYVLNSEAVDLSDKIALLSNFYAGKKLTIVSAYDIYFMDGSDVKQTVDGSFKVSMPIPEIYSMVSGDKLAVVHISDNGSVQKISATVNGDCMEFETDTFSVYAIIGLDIDVVKTYNLEGAKWVYTENRVYDGKAKVVYLDLDETNLSEEDKEFVYNNIIYKLNGVEVDLPLNLYVAGTYTISATLESDAIEVIGMPTALEYVIEKGVVYVTVEFDSDSPFEYDGQEHSVSVTYSVIFNGEALDVDDYIVTITGNKGAQSGSYKASFAIELTNPSLELEGEYSFTYDWVINKRTSEDPFGVGSVFGTNHGISVELKEGSIPADYEASSEETSLSASEITIIKELYQNKKITVVVAYDIHFVDGAKVEQQASGKFKVTMPIPEQFRSVSADKLVVIHITNDGQISVVDATKEGDNMVFETDGFSVYSIIQVEDEIIDDNPGPVDPVDPVTPVDPIAPENPVVDDNDGISNTALIVIIVLSVLLVICIIIIIILAVRRKKLHDENNNPDDTDTSDGDEVTEESVTADSAEECEAPVEETTQDEATVVEETAEEPQEEAPVEETPAEEVAEDTPEEDVQEETTEAPVEEPVAEEPQDEETAEVPQEEETVETPVEEPAEEEPVQDESAEAPQEETAEEPQEEVVETVAEEPAQEEQPVQEEEIQPVEAVVVDVNVDVEVPSEPQMVQVLDRSFTAKIALADETVKAYYNTIKNFALSFKNVRSRISWACDSINRGRKKICKVIVKGKSIILYLAIDPETLPAKYHAKSAGKAVKYQATPTKLRVKSGRSVKYAMEIIALIANGYGLKQGEVQSNNFVPSVNTEEELIAQGFIKSKLVKARTSTPWSK